MRVLLFQRLQPYLQIITGNQYNDFIMDLTPYLDGGFEFSTKNPGLHYRFTASIGKDSASLYEIFSNYLGCRVVVIDDDGQPCWDGILWETEISVGGNSLGPLTLAWVGNYCAVEYSDILNNNKYAITAYDESGESFDLYGLIERVLPYGQFTSVAATTAAGRYRANHFRPRLSGNIQVPLNSSDASLSITALGYWATSRYLQFKSIIATTVTVQDRIKEIVDRTVTRALTVSGTPQNYPYLEFFSTNTGLIEGTPLSIIRYGMHGETIGNYLERIISLGDASYNTWYIGAEIGNYDGHLPLGYPQVKVWQRPTAVEYTSDVSSGKVYNVSGVPVSPFSVRAGNCIGINGLIPVSNANQLPVFGDNTFVVQETRYNSRTGILSAIPEGGDEDVSIIIARMRG